MSENKRFAIKLLSKRASKMLSDFDLIIDEWNQNGNFNLAKFASSMSFNVNDNEELKKIKREALLKIRPLISGQYIDRNIIEAAIDNMGEAAVYMFDYGDEIDFSDYDVFIFDADSTIWEGEDAANMEPPYKFIKGTYTIVDKNGKKISLKEGVFDAITQLKEKGKSLGIISKSEKEGVDYQDQPVILLLKEFGLLEYFDKMIVVDREIPKSAFIPKEPRVVFIDDDIKNLIDVDEHTDADVVNADDVVFDAKNEDVLSFEEDLEPLDVLELCEGEDINDFDDWRENENEVIFAINQNTFVRAKIINNLQKNAAIAEEVDQDQFVEQKFNLRESQIFSPEFKKWFGDWENNSADSSKIVDKNGQPLVVYKGMVGVDWTNDSRPEIKHIERKELFPAFNGNEEGVRIAGFFSSDKEVASHFATIHGPNHPAVFPVYLNIRNPFVIDANGQPAGIFQFGKTGKEFRDVIRSGSCDGVIIKNTKDEGDVYVALNSYQIKSALGNNGMFSTEDNSLTAKNNDWYKEATVRIASRDWIPEDEKPEKPKDGDDYELDHKKPRWKGGKDTKENLEWVSKDKHEEKSKGEGSFEHGGDVHHEQLKEKGKKSYHDYQSHAAKEKVKQEKQELGEKGFSEKQREIANKRWHNK
jgi:magnesium-dependent phosphatase-1